ncbi:hypothetical protein D9M71_444760 [compost metagenome]
MSDESRNRMFDHADLQALRADCKLAHIDMSRARIQSDAARGGYVVTFAAPLFSLGNVLPSPPDRVQCHTASQAEGNLLLGLLKIQRAERQVCRHGRTFGWSPDQIQRRPLSVEEIADYKSEVAHRASGAKIQAELVDVLEKSAALAATTAGADELRTRYGMTAAPAPVAEQATSEGQIKAVPAKHQRGVKQS